MFDIRVCGFPSLCLSLFLFLSLTGVLQADVKHWPLSPVADKEAYVDKQGVLRWNGSSDEVTLLGVNYYTPFTVDYSEIKKNGGDHCQAILDDVAHFRRLGLGCVRIHCFDREFSDAQGNLIDNHHVELLDFLISTCASNGIYTVLTPIAWWGGAYAPGDTHGFSNDFTMQQMTTDPVAWNIQARFLKQFAEHVNRFTKRSYADDPAVLSFECINEPLYPDGTPDALVTRYINTLADALRASGTRKPIYYNSWHNRNVAAGAARIDGVTGVSYPTGLVAGHSLVGSQLLSACGSSLNPDAFIATKSRMIYEFDAADVPGSYMYPSMAKFFRSESVQVASQFQYDPLLLADVNQNWITHHLNLVYTPRKAISFAIAAEVFRRVPRGVTFGELPAAATFPPFRCSDTEAISEMAADDAFLYSNTTRTYAPNPEQLERVWGCGSSHCVNYAGTGAYFLDRVSAGLWRLQVYPDVFAAADPHVNTDQRKVHLLPSNHRMRVNLPDLGQDFSVFSFNGKTCENQTVRLENGSFEVTPGDFLLVRSSKQPKAELLSKAAAIAPAYVAPQVSSECSPLLRVQVRSQWRAGVQLPLQVDAVFSTNVTAELIAPDSSLRHLRMKRKDSRTTNYSVDVPSDMLTPGRWHLRFLASGPNGEISWPDQYTLDTEWLPVNDSSLSLLHVTAENESLQGVSVTKHGVATAEVKCVDGRSPDQNALRLRVDGIDGGASAAGFNQTFKPSRMPVINSDMGLRIVARSHEYGSALELGFRMHDGHGLGCNLYPSPKWREYRVPLRHMQPLWGLSSVDAFRWDQVDCVSVLTGAWLLKSSRDKPQTIDVQSVEWVQFQSVRPLTASAEFVPWSLFKVGDWLRMPTWSKPVKRWRTFDDAGRSAVHLGADGFNEQLDCISMRGTCDGATFSKLWQTEGADAMLHVCARGTTPETTAFELGFVESGGVAWGTVIKLTSEWQTVRIPVKELRFFSHWYPESVKSAGSHLRLSRLQKINVCFGRWLFPDKADQPHAIEISAIGITSGKTTSR